MIARIKKSKAKGRISAPPSKSMAHRLLICASLNAGSRVSNIAFSKDIEATLSCLKALGADYAINGDEITFLKSINPQDGAVLNCLESGSTLRFMIPICLCFNKEITLIGSERLFERPLSVYDKIAQNEGIKFIKGKNSLKLCGRLKGGKYTVRGDISSQFISGLMFALAILGKESQIVLKTELQSAPYVYMTMNALNGFGANIESSSDGFYIHESIISSGTFVNEGDWSNAAFLDVFNLLGGEVSVEGLFEESLQGDKIYREYFSEISKGKAVLDIKNCPDLGPILIALMAMLGGGRLIGTERLKIKESDRGAAMKEELLKLGVEIELGDDFINIPCCKLKKPNAPLFGHNDHRIVMSLVPILSLIGGEIEGAEAVSKSYPDYFERIKELGIEVELI